MWKQVLVLHLLIAISWQMRLKRQEDLDGCEWWDKICQESALKNSLSTHPSAVTSQQTTSTITQLIDGTVVQHESTHKVIISLLELINIKKLHTLNLKLLA
jgi:hypothetical protein